MIGIGIDLERIDGGAVARPRGDIDAASASMIHDELVGGVGPEAEDLVVDLSSTRFVDSAGLDMLFRLGERLRQRRATLRIVIPAESQLSRLVGIVGLPAAIPVHATLAEALAGRVDADRAAPSGEKVSAPDRVVGDAGGVERA